VDFIARPGAGWQQVASLAASNQGGAVVRVAMAPRLTSGLEACLRERLVTSGRRFARTGSLRLPGGFYSEAIHRMPRGPLLCWKQGPAHPRGAGVGSRVGSVGWRSGLWGG
jgi:hypothetical protein